MELKGKKYPVSIAIGTRDYMNSYGGTEKVISTHQMLFNNSNWNYIYLFGVNARIREKKLGQYWGCRINGNFVGIFSTSGIVEYIKKKYDRIIGSLCIHHLRLLEVDSVKQILDSFPNNKIWVYLHDYYLICENYNLLWNDKEYCGIGKNGLTCATCKYSNHSKQVMISELLKSLYSRVFFISPSEVAKTIFLKKYPEYTDKIFVVPHQKLRGEYREHKKELDENRKIKMAFCGAPTENKGWNIWLKLIDSLGKLGVYDFYHLGVQAKLEPENCTHIDVVFKQAELNVMISALRDNNIDLVFLWSNWPETYSYVYYECYAANAFIITKSDSGNIAHMVKTIGNGIVLNSYDDALELLSNPVKIKKLVNEFKSSPICGPEELADNNDVILLMSEEKPGNIAIIKKDRILNKFSATLMSLLYRIKRMC